MKTLGEKIREARKKKGWTQKELAEAVGTATVTIRQYEADKREPSNATLLSLASALGLPNAAYFFFDPVPEDAKSPAPTEGSGTEINPRYFDLSEENRAVVDAVIDQLSKAGQSDG